MAGRWLRRGAALIVLATLLATAGSTRAQAQGADDLATLNAKVEQLFKAGKFADALPVARMAAQTAEKQHGPDHLAVTGPLLILAEVLGGLDRVPEGEPFERRALAIREKVLGPNHPDTAAAVLALGGTFEQTNRLVEAEQFYQRGLAIYQAALGPDHPDVGSSLNNLAELYERQGRYAEAEPLYKRALAIREKALGPDHPDVGTLAQQPGLALPGPGPLRRGRAALQARLAIREKALGPDHPDVGTLAQQPGRAVPAPRAATPRPSRSTSARSPSARRRWGPTTPMSAPRSTTWPGCTTAQGRYAEAEPLYKRALAIREKALGPDHPDVGTSLNNLAVLYQAQGRYAEAEPLYKRALAIREKALGPDHPDVGTSLNNLAVLYQQPGPLRRGRAALQARARHPREGAGARPPRCRHLAQQPGRAVSTPRAATPRPSRSTSARSPSARRRWAPTTPMSAPRSTTWPSCTSAQGRYAEAEPLYKRALAIREKALGPDHPDVGTSLNNLAVLYRAQGRYAEAEPLYKRALAIREKALGPDHPDVGTVAQQPGRAVPSPGPLRRGRAALQARARHPREGAGARPPRRRHRRSTTWPSCIDDQGRYAEAEPLYKRALAIREKALGPDHPDVGTVAQQPGRALSSPGPLRRGRAALQARARHPREGAGARPPRCRHRRSTTWPCCTETRAATPRPSRSTSARSPSARRRWARPPRCRHVAQQPGRAVPRQGRYAEAEPLYKRASRSARRRWAPTTPMSAARSTTWPRSTSRNATGRAPPTSGGAARA